MSVKDIVRFFLNVLNLTYLIALELKFFTIFFVQINQPIIL